MQQQPTPEREKIYRFVKADDRTPKQSDIIMRLHGIEIRKGGWVSGSFCGYDAAHGWYPLSVRTSDIEWLEEISATASSPVMEYKPEGEIPQISDQLSGQSDIAALEYGTKMENLKGERSYDSCDIAEAHESGQIWMYRKLTAPAPPIEPGEQKSFCLDGDKIKRLLEKCLKPEEISGDAAVQHSRIDELISWFVRYSQGSANGKWLSGHAFELAYYIATNACNRFLDLEPVKKKAYYEGVNISPEERSFGERHGLIPKAETAVPKDPTGEKGDIALQWFIEKEKVDKLEVELGKATNQLAAANEKIKELQEWHDSHV